MKRVKHLLISTCLLGMMALATGCDFAPSNVDVEDIADADIVEIYNLYLKQGGDMTYEQWLSTIRGADGNPLGL